MRPSLDPDSAQLGHGSDKGPLKGIRVLGPCIDGGLGPAISKEDLVRCEEAHPLLEVLVVYIVKGPGSAWVHVDGYRGVHILGTHSLQLGHVCLVDCGVHWSARGEIVYAVGELVTVRESQCMGRCQENNIQM